jgi:hypothetical protein
VVLIDDRDQGLGFVGRDATDDDGDVVLVHHSLQRLGGAFR